MLYRSQSPRSYLLFRILILSLLIAAIIGSFLVPSTKVSAAASPDNTPLLLVHGYGDSCNGIFNSTNLPGRQDIRGQDSPGANATSTLSYLKNHGWGALDPQGASLVHAVKYYDYTYVGNSAFSNADPGCDANLLGSGNATGIQNCQSLLAGLSPGDPNSVPNISGHGSLFGTINDPIQHLGCLLAWYIYNTYTSQGKPVNILAHSMGGLIVRDALGQSGAGQPSYNSAFPPNPLNVSRVVTVATPHGGVSQYLMNWVPIVNNQIGDMLSTSSFMQNVLASIQKPQGSNGTFWGLVGASNAAWSFNPANDLACANTSLPSGGTSSCIASRNTHNQYPDTDGLVLATSALSMNADYKILYGVVDQVTWQGGTPSTITTYTADASTQYEHEANLCLNPTSNLAYCLSAPFFLNDGAPDSSLTQAWICTTACTNHDMTMFLDMGIGNGASVSTWHSLAVITWLLAPSTHWNSGHSVKTGTNPGLTPFQGNLWACWVDSSSPFHINVGKLTGATAAQTVNPQTSFSFITSLTDTSNLGCSLASFQGRLYVAFTGTNNAISIVSSIDGSNWDRRVQSPNTSSASPQLAVFGTKLYLVFTGTDGVVYIRGYDGNTTFNPQISLGQSPTTIGPAVAAYNNKIYVAIREQASNLIDLASMNIDANNNLINFSPFASLSGTSSLSAPALTSVNGLLDVGWRGLDSHMYVYGITGAGGSPVSVDSFSDITSAAPAISSINNQLVWAWSGTGNPGNLFIAAQF